ncbi:uncharacterized protein LOC126674871 [Mercurialis annua]|uniref:uncharacterized protein LOC126674871 n=1 Tax=Mercurialis annua TaxID=3986 RepID=UPI0021606DC9|nr:uncharacterized protein LOC126674871 [Mercurialis annua]
MRAVCNSYEESDAPLIYGCSAVADCWKIVRVPVLSIGSDDIVDWVQKWLFELEMEERSLVAMVCWYLWLNKNSIVWNKKLGSAQSIIAAASHQCTAWKVANAAMLQLRQVEISRDDAQVWWKPPPKDWMKVKVDAAVFGRSEGVGLGIVVRAGLVGSYSASSPH